MTEDKKKLEKIKKDFGFNPNDVGNRPRGYWIVDEIEEEEELAGAQIGDLCIKTRDGGGNEPDMKAGLFRNYVGTSCDNFDETYRYYYYRRLIN